MNNSNKIVPFLRRWYVVTSIVILIAAFVIRVHAGMLPQAADIPSPAMPSPNAWATFNAATAMEKESGVVDYAESPPSTEAIPPGEDVTKETSSWHHFPLARMDQLVVENRPAIAELRLGLTQQYMNPPLRSYKARMPYYAQYRALARLLKLQARDDALHGDWSASASSCLDAMKMGTMIPRGSSMIGFLVGMAMETIERRQFTRDVIDHLSSEECKRDAVRLAQIDTSRSPFSDTMQNEEWDEEASLIELFHEPDWRKEFLSLTGDAVDSNTGVPTSQSAHDLIMLYAASPKLSFERHKRYMDATVAITKLSWPQQKSAPEPKPDMNDPICRVIEPVFSRADFEWYVNTALDRLLETQLALRAYYLDHHAYPASLDQLAPAYLPSVPLDPFADNQPMKYRMNGRSSYTLYSIGPDTVDNGGRPIDNTEYFRGNSRNAQIHNPSEDPNAVGDIVAGVNR